MTKELKNRFYTSILLFSVLTLMYLYNYIMLCGVIIIAFISWIEFGNLTNKIFYLKKKNINVFKFLSNLLGISYITLFSLLIIFAFQGIDKFLTLYFLGVCIVSDLGGFFFGKIFKGKKLTKISPNKTRSGCIGSFIFSYLLMFFYISIEASINYLFLIIVTFLISLTTQLGDLFISYMKRKAKVKNTSDLLPGHGGVLDRIDGIIFGLPLGILFNYIF